MSEAYDAGDADDAAGEDLDLTNVPMDGAADAAGVGAADDGAKEGEVDPQARQPLPQAELERRYANTRTALSEERRQRRDLEDRLSRLESGGGRQERRADPEAEIDPEVDPLGALKQTTAKIKAYEAAQVLESQTVEQRQAQERVYAQVEAQLADHEADYREIRPDYDAAAKHYSTARAQELASFGHAPAQIGAMLRKEFTDLAQTAIGARKNPAAVVYELAKRRGYGGKAADLAPGDGELSARDANGRFLPAGGGKLDAVASGQRATSPMGRAGGRTNAGLDVRTVANINIQDKKGGAAFDKAFDALERAAKRAERG